MQAEVLERIGRYEIEGELGAGSMSRVYLAHDPNLDRQVAVKVMLRGFSLDNREQGELERRFLLEARAAGKLSHPGIVRVYDADTDPALGIPYIAMELVQGRSLRGFLEEKGRLDGARTLDILSQVARALDYAHSLGRIHRDIKPSNILIGTDGIAKVSDFGVAKIVSETHTVSGQILGTPAYMSPEQVRDDPLDGRSDLFSLGAVLYQCVGGSTPFAGESLVQIVYKILNVDPRPLHLGGAPALERLERVTMRALQKDPGRRFQTGAELAQALDSIRSELDADSTPGLKRPSPASPTRETSTVVPLPVATRRRGNVPVTRLREGTRTVRLSTTSIHRAAASQRHRLASKWTSPEHDDRITERPLSPRVRWLGWLLLPFLLTTWLLWTLGAGREPSATEEPIRVLSATEAIAAGSTPSPQLRFPESPEPDLQSANRPQHSWVDQSSGKKESVPAIRITRPETRPQAPENTEADPVATSEPADGSSPEKALAPPTEGLPPTILTPVTIVYKHKGGPAFLSIALDGQPVWSQELQAVEGRLQKLTGYEARAVVPVPSGTHTLKVTLTDPERGIETAGSIRSRYTNGTARRLRVSVDGSGNTLQLRWKE